MSGGSPPGLHVALLVMLSACGKVPSASPSVTAHAAQPPVSAPPPVDAGAPAASGPAHLTARAVPLPGARGPVTVDYLVYDRAHSRVWVPVGDTGSADVLDVATGTFQRVDGFDAAPREGRGTRRRMGPSAVTVGDGVVYIGDRATYEVCAVDERTLALGACLALPAATDGVAYVASTKEVWVTTPRDRALAVLDASRPDALKPKLVIKTDGDPEGYAVDPARGLFYTNLEDKDLTLGIDVRTHTVKSRWAAGCGEDGPRGLALDVARNFVFVACTDGVRILDGAHGGAPLGKLTTGGGVDNLDYREDAKTLYVAAARASRLTVARVGDDGQPTVVATGATADGARNAVVDADGRAYVVDPGAARLLIFDAPPKW